MSNQSMYFTWNLLRVCINNILQCYEIWTLLTCHVKGDKIIICVTHNKNIKIKN